MSLDGLTPEQRQRLDVLRTVKIDLGDSADAFDLVRYAHWVIAGTELPVSGQVFGEPVRMDL